MSNYSKKEKLFYSITGVAMFILLLFLMFYPNRWLSDAEKGKKTRAMVYDKFKYSRGRSGIRYVFNYQGVRYRRSSVFSGALKIPIGDSILISFDEKAPEHSVPVFDSLLY